MEKEKERTFCDRKRAGLSCMQHLLCFCSVKATRSCSECFFRVAVYQGFRRVQDANIYARKSFYLAAHFLHSDDRSFFVYRSGTAKQCVLRGTAKQADGRFDLFQERFMQRTPHSGMFVQ